MYFMALLNSFQFVGSAGYLAFFVVLCFEYTGQEFKKLVPIDHGMTIPDSLEICSYDLVWLSFDQAEAPFSPKTL